ncbi:hypothetical protein KC219_28345, partial [Mycobacterium tuberculosis]|nr:hypothetical protein [Mycobacterium tuberculosis]
IAHRMFRPSEPILDEFAQMTRTGVVLYAAGRVITTARLDAAPAYPISRDGSALLTTADRSQVSRCAEVLGHGELCI